MKRLLLTVATCIMATAASAQDIETKAKDILESTLRAWGQDATIQTAVTAQNQANAAITDDQIATLDAAWQAEIAASEQPTITPILNNSAADFLRAKISESAGLVTEAFVMDQHGLNVATAAITSDMWQGDEAKFQETYGKGADAVHMSEVEYDESSQSYQMQLSFPLTDDSGALIGAMTVAVNAEALE